MVKAPDLPLERLSNHALAARIEVLGVVKTEATPRAGFVAMPGGEMQPTGIVFRYGGRRYVADLGQPIVDEAGAAIEPLQGWMLTFATDKFAVLSRGGSDALVEVTAK